MESKPWPVRVLYGSHIVPIVNEEARLRSSLPVSWSDWVGGSLMWLDGECWMKWQLIEINGLVVFLMLNHSTLVLIYLEDRKGNLMHETKARASHALTSRPSYPPLIIPFIHWCFRLNTPTVSISRISAVYCRCRWKYKWSENQGWSGPPWCVSVSVQPDECSVSQTWWRQSWPQTFNVGGSSVFIYELLENYLQDVPLVNHQINVYDHGSIKTIYRTSCL